MIKLIGLIVDVVKMILNVKKWINTVYRVVMYCHDHPVYATLWVLGVILGGIWVYHSPL